MELKRDYEKMFTQFQEIEKEKQASIPTISFDNNKVVQLSVDSLNPFHNHPFELCTGERFENLTDSIKACGVITPLLIRKLDDNTYQILSGHNRNQAAKAIGLKTVPCIVLADLTDDDALMIMIDSNTNQRSVSEMPISQQAHIYALDVAVNKRQGKRSDLIKNIEKNLEILSNGADFGTCSPLGKKLNTVQEVGDKYGVSKNTVARLIRIDTLLPQLKEHIDSKQISVRAGVELSYITVFEQALIAKIIDEYNFYLDEHKAHQLRELSKAHKLDRITVVEVFEGKYGKSVTKKLKSFTIKPKFLSKYYPPTVSQDVIASDVEASMDVWQEIKTFYPDTSADDIKSNIINLLNNQKQQ